MLETLLLELALVLETLLLEDMPELHGAQVLAGSVGELVWDHSSHSL